MDQLIFLTEFCTKVPRAERRGAFSVAIIKRLSRKSPVSVNSGNGRLCAFWALGRRTPNSMRLKNLFSRTLRHFFCLAIRQYGFAKEAPHCTKKQVLQVRSIGENCPYKICPSKFACGTILSRTNYRHALSGYSMVCIEVSLFFL